MNRDDTRRGLRRRWLVSWLAPWLVASLALHVALSSAFSGLASERAGVPDERAGDAGRAGAGGRDAEVEITVLAAPPAIAPPAAPARADEVDAQREAASAVGPTDGSAPRPPRPTRDGSLAIERAQPSDAMAPSGEGEASSGGGASELPIAAPSAPTRDGADTEARAAAVRAILGSTGRLEGDSVRTSAVLGEALSCDDPIVGTWTSYRYSPEYRDWARFTLRIRREGAGLAGTIVTRIWRGLPSERRPPPCTADGWDYTVTMRATGNLMGDQFSFAARTQSVTRVDCASSYFAYNPDHFTGQLDAFAERLLTVNNDGGRDVNAPYEFRRTRCAP